MIITVSVLSLIINYTTKPYFRLKSCLVRGNVKRTRRQNKKWAFITRHICLVPPDLTLSLFSRVSSNGDQPRLRWSLHALRGHLSPIPYFILTSEGQDEWQVLPEDKRTSPVTCVSSAGLYQHAQVCVWDCKFWSHASKISWIRYCLKFLPDIYQFSIRREIKYILILSKFRWYP
jgi:hypothetical protein